MHMVYRKPKSSFLAMELEDISDAATAYEMTQLNRCKTSIALLKVTQAAVITFVDIFN